MENKAMIIYKSKTGFTEKYARWLAQATGCEAIPYARRNQVNLAQYETIVYGGGFYAGMIGGLKWLKERLPELGNRRVAVFATGGMPAKAQDIEATLRKNFTQEEWTRVKVFYMPGGMCYERMSIVDRLLMAMFRKMLAKQEGENSEMLKAIQSSYDLTSQEAINPLTEWIAQWDGV